jgi:hypothetical protein
VNKWTVYICIYRRTNEMEKSLRAFNIYTYIYIWYRLHAYLISKKLTTEHMTSIWESRKTCTIHTKLQWFFYIYFSFANFMSWFEIEQLSSIANINMGEILNFLMEFIISVFYFFQFNSKLIQINYDSLCFTLSLSVV